MDERKEKLFDSILENINFCGQTASILEQNICREFGFDSRYPNGFPRNSHVAEEIDTLYEKINKLLNDVLWLRRMSVSEAKETPQVFNLEQVGPSSN